MKKKTTKCLVANLILYIFADIECGFSGRNGIRFYADRKIFRKPTNGNVYVVDCQRYINICRHGREVPMSQIDALRNSRSVRWYVLTLPSCHKGRASGLQAELDRRRRRGEDMFEFFAPTYTEVTRNGNGWVRTDRPLLYNYVFVKASENDIYRMMTSGLGIYSFLPRVRDGRGGHYPYLSDKAMDNLKWVARSYSDVLPVCPMKPEYLLKGDRVRITDGQFKDAEATVWSRSGTGQKEVVVCVEDWLCVPLMHVRPDQYEIISLNPDPARLYARLDNMRLLGRLHDALSHLYGEGKVTVEDKAVACGVIRQYRHIEVDSDIMRCKLYSALLQAYTILDDDDGRRHIIGTVTGMLPYVSAEQSRALLAVTLYGCTDSSIWHSQAHALVDRWRGEDNLKKNRQRLVAWLDDFDRWFGH